MRKIISGFSKLSMKEKINWLIENYFHNQSETLKTITQYWNSDTALQQLHDDFIENTISNFYMPFGIAPNFVINNKDYVIPMVVEESSVVAAASKSAKFWMYRGGFKTQESVSKGDPITLKGNIMEYTLTRSTLGNFSPKSSNLDEAL